MKSESRNFTIFHERLGRQAAVSVTLALQLGRRYPRPRRMPRSGTNEDMRRTRISIRQGGREHVASNSLSLADAKLFDNGWTALLSVRQRMVGARKFEVRVAEVSASSGQRCHYLYFNLWYSDCRYCVHNSVADTRGMNSSQPVSQYRYAKSGRHVRLEVRKEKEPVTSPTIRPKDRTN